MPGKNQLFINRLQSACFQLLSQATFCTSFIGCILSVSSKNCRAVAPQHPINHLSFQRVNRGAQNDKFAILHTPFRALLFDVSIRNMRRTGWITAARDNRNFFRRTCELPDARSVNSELTSPAHLWSDRVV